MKHQITLLTIFTLAANVFAQQTNLELYVGDKIFTQDTTIDIVPNCSLKIDCRIINKTIPSDSLKLFYGVNAPNDIIAFPANGGSFYYVPQLLDTVQQVILDFRLFYGDTPLSRMQLSINVKQPQPVAVILPGQKPKSAVSYPAAYFDLAGRAISGRSIHAVDQVYAQRQVTGSQIVVNRFAR